MNNKFTIDLAASTVQKVKFQTSGGNITAATIVVKFNGEVFERFATDIQLELRTVCEKLSKHVRSYLGLSVASDTVTYTGHSYFNTNGDDDFGVVLSYYYKGMDGSGVGQALPKIVFEKTAYGDSTALMIDLERADHLAKQLFAGWSPQMSLFDESGNDGGGTTTYTSNAVTTAQVGEVTQEDDPDNNAPANADAAPIANDKPEKKGKPDKGQKPNTPFQVVEADPSDDLPTIRDQEVSREVNGMEIEGSTEVASTEAGNIAVNQ